MTIVVGILSHLTMGMHGGNLMKHKDKWQPIALMILYPIAMACGMKVELPVFTGYQDWFIPSYLRLLGCFWYWERERSGKTDITLRCCFMSHAEHWCLALWWEKRDLSGCLDDPLRGSGHTYFPFSRVLWYDNTRLQNITTIGVCKGEALKWKKSVTVIPHHFIFPVFADCCNRW